jgi:hypothetical protein
MFGRYANHQTTGICIKIFILNKQFHYFSKIYIKKTPDKKHVLSLSLGRFQYIALVQYKL